MILRGSSMVTILGRGCWLGCLIYFYILWVVVFYMGTLSLGDLGVENSNMVCHEFALILMGKGQRCDDDECLKMSNTSVPDSSDTNLPISCRP
jgi:hypothetical protein